MWFRKDDVIKLVSVHTEKIIATQTVLLTDLKMTIIINTHNTLSSEEKKESWIIILISWHIKSFRHSECISSAVIVGDSNADVLNHLQS